MLFVNTQRAISVFCGIVFAINLSSVAASAQKKRLLQVDDIFAVKQIVDLQMSPPGDEIIYVLQEANLKENRFVKTIWRLPTTGEGQPVRLTDSDKDYSPRWSPVGKAIAFLSSRSGLVQIWTLDLTTGTLEKLTDSPTGVLSFKWSPNGQYVAYTSQEDGTGTFAKDIRNGERGVVIDKQTFVVYRLLRNERFYDLEKNVHLTILKLGLHETRQVSGTQHVQDFAWSPDSGALALTTRPARADYWNSDIVTYSLKNQQIDISLRGERGETLDEVTNYFSPLWSPDGTRLTVLYRQAKNRWASIPQVGVYSLQQRKLQLISKGIEVTPEPNFYWSNDDNIYFEHTINGDRGLFALSSSNGSVKPIINNTEACEDEFSFSKDSKRVAYVYQSHQQPPEIYVSDFPFKTKSRLTSLNVSFEGIQLPDTERLRWKAPDGVQVEGTLFKPTNYTTGKAYPLLVLVHGGPNIPIENRFEPYSLGASWIWPYPFRLFANRGYAVFLPDYRGTASYGQAFLAPRDLMKDPSDDIISGIEYLVKNRVADRNMIGLLGQSHGAWLGACIMAYHRIFTAASFAEGGGNMITNYAQMSGSLNLKIHDYYNNGSPYENPQRYIELSPVFNLRNLNTATLLEYGEQSLAVQGLEMLTALWRQGVPHEMIIYPKTGHNFSSPMFMQESAIRNLDWFDYWMLGRRDSDPSKQDQYARWEAMKVKMNKMRLRNSSRQAAQSGNQPRPKQVSTVTR